jgi:hypothetical protein
MRLLAAFILLIATCQAIGAPPAERQPTEPAPIIEPTGPLRLTRYVRPFAQAQPSRATRDYASRYTYVTPGYFYGCGYYGYCGWYGYGYGYYHPICYPYGPYYPCY